MKIAVILFNLGGPASLDAVKPFLFNLFNDKAIISAPAPIRFLLAKFISAKREQTAQEIYQNIGGKSPILEETQAQADALSDLLQVPDDEYKNIGANNFRIFISMRYAPPFTQDIMPEIAKFNADKIILLPLYPQYSTTTTQSSFDEWDQISKKFSFQSQIVKINYYHLNKKFIQAHVNLIKKYYKNGHRILFSAHGLPEKIAQRKNEIYPQQIEENVKAIINKLGRGLDYTICYQSRVGPLKWIGPSLDDEIIRAGNDNKNVTIVPISFVSEHSETLVELDIEYKEMAQQYGIEEYIRIPALGTDELFIESLRDIVTENIK